jgi:hypothetical protein
VGVDVDVRVRRLERGDVVEELLVVHRLGRRWQPVDRDRHLGVRGLLVRRLAARGQRHP